MLSLTRAIHMSQFFESTGYNKADLQFHEQDERLLRELRGKLDARRSEIEQAHSKSAHWMKCPKCGGQLKEMQLTEVKDKVVLIDQCQSCGGVYFDAGELAMLIGHDPRAHGMVERLFSWLPRYQEAADLLWPKRKK